VINDPDLLILDEPFAGLDPINLDLLKEIMTGFRDTGKTVIFSTHMMEHAEKLCDYILLINGGKKVIDGTLDQIRSEYDTNIVSVILEGDTGFLKELRMIDSIKKAGKRLEIVLKDGSDHQELLQAVIKRTRVNAFEVKVPSLHEIFVHLVRKNR
jgi:ABC-2 type transport system ATP-binding protein